MDHAQRSSNRWQEVLAEYEQPPLPDGVEESLIEFVAKRAEELGDDVPLPGRS
jgi:trimethylamine:corrinoid methyltransferase-like protein